MKVVLKSRADGAGAAIFAQLKAKNPIEWVCRMNNIRERVNEVVNAEMIFT